MAREWYCELHSKNGQPRKEPRVFGPLRVRELKHLARTGQLTPTDRVRRGANGAWREAGSLKGLFERQDAVSGAARQTEAGRSTTPEAAGAPAGVAVADAAAPSTSPLETRVHDAATSPDVPLSPATAVDPVASHGAALSGVAVPPADVSESGIREWRKLQLLQQAQWMAQHIQQVESGSSSVEIPVSGTAAAPPPSSGEVPAASALLPSQLQSLQQDPWYALLQRRIQQAGIVSVGADTNPRQWYRESHGVVTGPMQLEDLVLLARAGRLAVGDNIRWGLSGPWVPLFSDTPGSSWPASATPSAPLAAGGVPGSTSPPSASAWEWGNEPPSTIRRPRPPKLPPVRIPPPTSVAQPVDLTDASEPPSAPPAEVSPNADVHKPSDNGRPRCSEAAAQLLAQFSGRTRRDSSAEKKAVDPLKLVRARPKSFTPPTAPAAEATPPPSQQPAAARAATRTDVPRVPRKPKGSSRPYARWIFPGGAALLLLCLVPVLFTGRSDARICRELESIWSQYKQLREQPAPNAELHAFAQEARAKLADYEAYLKKTAGRTERAKQRLLHITESLQQVIDGANATRSQANAALEQSIEDGFAEVHRMLGVEAP